MPVCLAVCPATECAPIADMSRGVINMYRDDTWIIVYTTTKIVLFAKNSNDNCLKQKPEVHLGNVVCSHRLRFAGKSPQVLCFHYVFS